MAVVVRTVCAVPSTTRLTLVGLRAVDKPLGRTGKEEEVRPTVPMNPPTLKIRIELTTEEPAGVESVGPVSKVTPADDPAVGLIGTRSVLIPTKPSSVSLTVSLMEKLPE